MTRDIKDHSPSKYPQHREALLLVSFDELAEIDHHPWIREATPNEVEEERARLTASRPIAGTDEVAPGRSDFDELSVDNEGRPYRWAVVAKDAPGHVWRQATGHLRILRFRDKG